MLSNYVIFSTGWIYFSDSTELKRVFIEDSIFDKNCGGKIEGAGIIESSATQLNNFTFLNCIFRDNYGYFGVLIGWLITETCYIYIINSLLEFNNLLYNFVYNIAVFENWSKSSGNFITRNCTFINRQPPELDVKIGRSVRSNYTDYDSKFINFSSSEFLSLLYGAAGTTIKLVNSYISSNNPNSKGISLTVADSSVLILINVTMITVKASSPGMILILDNS